MKCEVNKPELCILFDVQSLEIVKQKIGGVACKQIGNYQNICHGIQSLLFVKGSLSLVSLSYHAKLNFCLFRDISGPEYRWALKMGQRPISHSFTYKIQDFDGPFCILMGLLEKMTGPRILNRHLTAKLTSNLNNLCMRPNQKLKQI